MLVDELWVFGKRSNAEAMFLEALGGQISRDEGWVIFLTTQSDEPPAGVFKLNYWRDVRDGKTDDRKTLGVLYEFPAAMVEERITSNRRTFTSPIRTLAARSVRNGWKTNSKEIRPRRTAPIQRVPCKHLERRDRPEPALRPLGRGRFLA